MWTMSRWWAIFDQFDPQFFSFFVKFYEVCGSLASKQLIDRSPSIQLLEVQLAFYKNPQFDDALIQSITKSRLPMRIFVPDAVLNHIEESLNRTKMIWKLAAWWYRENLESRCQYSCLKESCQVRNCGFDLKLIRRRY